MIDLVQRYLFWAALPRGKTPKTRLVLEATPGRLRLLVPNRSSQSAAARSMPGWALHAVPFLLGIVLSAVLNLVEPFFFNLVVFTIFVAILFTLILTYYALNVRVWRFAVRKPMASHDVRVVEARSAISGLRVRLALRRPPLTSTRDSQADAEFEVASGFSDGEYLTVTGTRRRIKEAFELAGQLVTSATD